MKKRFLQRKNTRMYHVWLRSFMVCLCLALAGVSAWGQDKNYTFSGGTGTENDPYLISSVEDLKNMAEAVNQGTASSTYNEKHYKLTKNLTLTPEDVDSWKPIGPVHFAFSGSFDGGGNTISGFNASHTITEQDKPFGFFGTISENATIKNLIVCGNINIKMGEGLWFGVVGGICGHSEGHIEECIYKGKIKISSDVEKPAIPNAVGGICGRLNNGGKISGCCSKESEIEVTLVNHPYSNSDFSRFACGGVVGRIEGRSSIDACFYTGSIVLDITSNSFLHAGVGGIIGYSDPNQYDAPSISNCYNEGKITVKGANNEMYYVSVGGVLGGGPLTGGSCYNIGDIEVEDIVVEGSLGIFTGGVVGTLESESLTGNPVKIENCYNYGKINTTGSNVIKGNAYAAFTQVEVTSNKCYYLKEKGIENAYDKDQAVGILNSDFMAGKVAWLLRDAGFGQNLNGSPSDEYPKLQSLDDVPAVYQLKYKKDTEETQYYNPGQITEALPELESDLRWFGEDGTIYESGFSMPAKDLVLTAETGYSITKQVEHGTISIAPNQTLYKAGTPITVTVKADEGYQFKSLECKTTANVAVEVSKQDDETYTFTMPTANVAITAMFELIPPTMYKINIAPTENGTVTSDKTKAAVGETITLTVTLADGYELSELYYMIGTGKTSITGTTFAMPESDVTVYATFKEKEDPTDPEEPVDPPVVDPTNYYNIYNETTYDFIDVSFSRNVVREGGSVNVYLEIPEGLDPAAVTLMFKRGMYGYWENLNTDDDGNYPIRNIWTDIYVKAVVDESYIDPNPDENHIYIDLSETNDSIWLYTDHKLVEEGKTAVIQAEVAKSCQNKEIRYMYKRTVLGEWKEMPKDYSINQYVVRDITTDIYVKAYFVFDKQDPTTAKNPHHVYADITATCEGLYLDATRHKVADEGDTKVFLYVKKGFETKDARYLFKRGLKGEWEDLVPGIEQNTFQVTDIEGDIYLKGIDAVYTGTEDIDGMVRVYTKDGSLFVYTAQPEEISVVSMTGVTVKRTRQTGLQSYPLNQGIYVICVGEQVFKVRVK